MQPWEDTVISHATLGDYVNAQMMVSGWGRERIFISQFFGDQEYIAVEEHSATYQHNLAQFVMKDFFETNKGLKRVLECNPDDGDRQTAAVYEEIEYDYKKTFRGFSDAAIGFEDTEGNKILVMVSRHDVNDIHYRVMAPESHANLLKEWFALARTQNFYKGKKINATCGFLELQDHNWEDVILPANIISLLKNMVQGAIAKEPIYRKNKLSLKRGIMLSGKPGNGKTSAIKVIAKEVPDTVTVIYAQPSNLVYAKDVRGVCSMARDLAPCVLIIEDIDWIAEDRDTGDAGRVIELMNQLDGIEEFSNVITIATTNDVDKIEKAIKNRPGRFDRIVNIDNPDEDCRRRMLALFTKHWTISKDVDRERIVNFSDGLSGAHMHDLCVTMAMKAIEDDSLDENEIVVVKADHFEQAIKEVKDKDFSTYMKQKSTTKKKGIGFHASPFDEDDD